MQASRRWREENLTVRWKSSGSESFPHGITPPGRRADDKGRLALNIKNKETCRLIEELSRATGENMTEAVTEAVRERLKRVREQRKQSPAERLLAIGKDCAAHLKGPYRSADHDDLLYDEKGLPR